MLAPTGIGIVVAIGVSADPRAALIAGAAAVAIGVAMMAPSLIVAALLIVVLVQDAIVDAGFDAARYGDEALLLAGLVGLVANAIRGWLRGDGTDRDLERATARTPLDLPLLALTGVMLASAIAAAVPVHITALGMLALLKGPLAFQLAARIPLDHARVRRVAGALVALAAVAALVGVAQRLGGEGVFALTGQAEYFDTWFGVKAPGPFSHHNALGHVTVLGGALALALAGAVAGSGGRSGGRGSRAGRRRGWAGWLWGSAGQRRDRTGPQSTEGGRWRTPVVAWLGIGGLFAGLLASASRESWIAAAAAAMVVAGLTRRWRALGAAGALSATLVILGGLSYFVSPMLRAEMARRLAGVTAGWLDFGAGFTGWAFRGEYRVYAALKSAEIWSDHPLLGVGPGRFGGAVAQRFGSPVHEAYRVLPLDGVHEPLDLFWARLPAEIGLLGAATYLLVFGAAMAVCVRAAGSGRVRRIGGAEATSRSEDEASTLVRALGYGGVGALVAAIVFATFSPALEDPLVAIPVFVWAGVVWGMGREVREVREVRG